MDTAEIQAMEDERLLAVKGKQHAEAFSDSLNWTAIDETPRPEQENVRILPGEAVQKFSREQILFQEQIGGGAQGKIYNASLLMEGTDGEYLATNGKYAVKKFNGTFYHNRFGQWPEELIGLHSQRHHVCKFYGYFDDEDSFCLLMQKYDYDLHACINKKMKKGWFKRRPFHDYATMGIIIQIAIGMAYVHHLNIVHRDLKSDNIFVNMSEDDDFKPRIFIGDFDTAPTVIGTALWRAPEILQALKRTQRFLNVAGVDTSEYSKEKRGLPFTKKSDVYSFGLICYEVLTGGVPFEVHRRDFDGVLSGERPKLPSNLNPKMRDMLSRCWHHDPDARPTFMEIVMELKGLVEETQSLMSYFTSIYAFRQITAADPESNLVELRKMVHVLGDKYTPEDFVGLGFQLLNAIEQFNLEFGLRSFTEHPSLPFSKWLARLVLLEATDFRRRMFLAACPQAIPEYLPIFNLIQVLFNDTMRRSSTTTPNADAIIREDHISAEEMAGSWKAWSEEMQRRPRPFEIDLLERQKVLGIQQIVSRHEVCNALLTGKLTIGRDIYQPCDFCKALPCYASKPPHLEASTFHLYAPNYVTLKSAITLLFHTMRKLFLCWL